MIFECGISGVFVAFEDENEGRTFEPRGPGPPAGRGRGKGSGASGASPPPVSAPWGCTKIHEEPKNQGLFGNSGGPAKGADSVG